MKRLAGQTSIYGSGLMLSNATVFFLLPVYLRYLNPSEFGVLSLARISPMFIMPVISLNLHGAVIRFYYEWKEKGYEREGVFTLWIFSLLWAAGVTLLCIFLGETVLGFLFKQVPFDPYVKLAIFAESVTVTALLSNKLMRIKEMAKTYSAFNYLTTLLTLGLVIFFVVFQEAGVIGVLKGFLLSNLIMMIPYTLFIFKNSRARFSYEPLRESLSYCLPLVPGGLINSIAGVLDQFLLEKFVPTAQIGIYSLAKRISQIIAMVASILQIGMMPFFVRTALERVDYQLIIGRAFFYFVNILLIASIAITVFSPEIILLLGREAYLASSVFVGPLVFAIVLGSLTFLPEVQVMLAKKTKYASLVALVKFVLLVGIGYPIISFLEVKGAIITYVLVNLLTLILFGFIGHRCFPVEEQFRKLANIIGLALVVGALATYYNGINSSGVSFETFSFKIIILFLYWFLTVIIGFRIKIFGFVRNKFR
jgi:O-antigen/teichoic acid export membrane protein